MLNHKPVLLVFIDWFIPGYKAGGPITSCLNFVHLMKNEYTVYVFTTDTDLGETHPYNNIVPDTWVNGPGNGYMVYYARKNKLSGEQIRTVTASVKPDFIYLNHIFSVWFVIYQLWLKWKGIITCKVVVCPRGALYESALYVKPWKKMPFLKLFRWLGIHKMVRFHATSDREKKAVLHFFPNSDVMVADDLPNTIQLSLEQLPKETGVLKAIFIARIHPIKNLLFLLQVLAQIKSEITLTIVGPVEDLLYWEKCKAYINNLRKNISIRYEGPLPNHALLPLLQHHHLFVLPTKGENFGHAIFESLLCGRPVLISDQTPWLQLENIKIGWDFPLDQPSGFIEAIETAAAWDQATFTEWSRCSWQYARKFITNPALKQQYVQLFS